MSDPANPYQTPASPNEVPLPGSDLIALKGIAESQRRVNLCLLGQLAVLLGSRAVGQGMAGMAVLIGIVFIITAIATVFCNAQLAKRIKGTGTAVAVGLLSLLPLVGLLMLLMVSNWATKMLKEAGFKVGLLGGSPGEIQKAIDAGRGGQPAGF